MCRRTVIVGIAVLVTVAGSGAEPTNLERWIDDAGGSVVRGGDGRIEAIDLSRSWVSDIDLRQLEGMDQLERLALSQTHVTDSALEVVGRLPALRELDLFFCEHITDSGASMLRQATRLERLNVRGTKISDSGVKFLAELRNLRQLDIGITEISDATVELLEVLPTLETLSIGGNRVSEVGISSLRSLKRLRHLDLSGAQETDSGIWAVDITDLNLKDLVALEGLESLNLAAPSREYVEAVSTGVPRLRGSIRVTDSGAAQIAKLSRLRRLNLTRSLVTAEGIRTLQALPQLEEFNLSHATAIDDSAGGALALLPNLRILDVSFTRFGDRALDDLRDHTSLERVIAAGTPVSAEAASRFVATRRGRSVAR